MLLLLQNTTSAADAAAMSSSIMPPPAPAIMLAAAVMLGLVLTVAFRRRNKAAAVCNKGAGVRVLPPGPRGLPVLGNMHQMLANKPVHRWLHRLLSDAGGDGGIVRVRLGPVHVIAVSSPEIAREVLRGRNDAVFADRPTTFAAESFSVGYLSASISPFGDQWRKMRRVLTAEILSPATERRLAAVREGEADHLLRYVRALCGAGAAVDVRHVARHFCGNVIRRLTLGRRHFAAGSGGGGGVRGPGRDEEEHVGALFATLNYLDAFCVSDYFPALVGLDLDGHERVVRGVMRTLRRLHDPVVEERVEEWRLLRKAGERREPADFLDVLASLDDDAGRPMLTVD